MQNILITWEASQVTVYLTVLLKNVFELVISMNFYRSNCTFGKLQKPSESFKNAQWFTEKFDEIPSRTLNAWKGCFTYIWAALIFSREIVKFSKPSHFKKLHKHFDEHLIHSTFVSNSKPWAYQIFYIWVWYVKHPNQLKPSKSILYKILGRIVSYVLNVINGKLLGQATKLFG